MRHAGSAGELAGEPLDPVFHPTKDNFFVVTLNGPVLLEEWRQEIERFGVELLERRGESQYLCRLSLAQVSQLRTLDCVQSVELLSPAETRAAAFSPMLEVAGVGAAPRELVPFDIVVHDAKDIDDVERWLTQNGVQIVAKGRRKLRIRLAADSTQLRQIQALPEVADVQEYVPPTLANDRARRLLAVDDVVNHGALTHTGAGEVIGVADTGLDDGHECFKGRVRAVIARGRANDGSDPHGHGTHVAASAVGVGKDGSGIGRGVAPAAQLVFQAIMDAHGKLGGLPLELGDLFEEAYGNGARIHNNSWSADTKSFYTVSSREVDEFVHSHPDMLVVFAAGNDATARQPFNSQIGFVDWQTIGSPATAKNALTVGASRSDRALEGYSQKTYRHFDVTRFADPPIADALVSGDPQCLAAFSGRGPCDSSRIKPDVVAPGTDILSARASSTPDHHFWGTPDDPALAGYAYLGGTSMAAPLVTGCAAIIRQHYREVRNANPSAALLKATIVNSTRWLLGPDATADHQFMPNYHQGFGAVYLPYALPNQLEPWMALEFVDSRTAPSQQLTANGDRRRFAFTVRGGAFLRICLSWTDPPPGPGIQNALALMLEGPLSPPKVAGNHQRPRMIDRVDRDNNVQVVRLDAPPGGNYMVVVLARNLLRPPQDYALVVSGDITRLVEV